MSTEIAIVTFSDYTKESFKSNVSEPFCYCTSCGKTNPYTKDKLPKYLTQFQITAGKQKLPCPDELFFKFIATEKETVVVTHIFSPSTTKEVEKGHVTLYLTFEEDLSEADQKIWLYILQGFFAATKVLY